MSSAADVENLDKAIRRRDWKRDYLLYEAGNSGLYHLGEKKILGLHLIDATAIEVMNFVCDRAPRMFRFAGQMFDWQWMHYLDSEWFHRLDSIYNTSNVETDTWAYLEVLTYSLKFQFDHTDLPGYPGIYVVTDARDATLYPDILYVGKAQKDIRDRWRRHHKVPELALIAPLIHIHCFNAAFLNFESLRDAEIRFSEQLQPLLNRRIG